MENTPPLEPLVFTRYLYPKLYVKHSLFVSLLEKQYEESLFWAYELYFSGFEEEIFKFIFQVYKDVYEVDNSFFKEFMEKAFDEWKEDNEKDNIIGTLVGTISQFDYRIDGFMKTYFNINCKKESKVSKKRMIIQYKPENVQKYYTMKPLEKSYKYLREVCNCAIKKDLVSLFKTEINLSDSSELIL